MAKEPLEILSIFISPNFDNSLRLIDVAGLSSSKTIEKLKDLVSREMAYLFYIKSLDSEEDIKENGGGIPKKLTKELRNCSMINNSQYCEKCAKELNYKCPDCGKEIKLVRFC